MATAANKFTSQALLSSKYHAALSLILYNAKILVCEIPNCCTAAHAQIPPDNSLRCSLKYLLLKYPSYSVYLVC